MSVNVKNVSGNQLTVSASSENTILQNITIETSSSCESVTVTTSDGTVYSANVDVFVSTTCSFSLLLSLYGNNVLQFKSDTAMWITKVKADVAIGNTDITLSPYLEGEFFKFSAN
jgi:hypothetical protein